MFLLPATWKLAAAAVALVVAAGAGWRQGVLHTRAAWQAADVAREHAQLEALGEDRRRAARASTTHEERRAAIAAALPEAQHDIRAALSAPLDCKTDPPGSSRLADRALGDVLVPAAALAGLRHAAGDDDPPGSAAAQPRGSLFGRPGDPGR